MKIRHLNKKNRLRARRYARNTKVNIFLANKWRRSELAWAFIWKHTKEGAPYWSQLDGLNELDPVKPRGPIRKVTYCSKVVTIMKVYHKICRNVRNKKNKRITFKTKEVRYKV